MKYINGQNGIFVEGVKFDGEKKVSSTRAPTCLVKLLSCQKCSRRAAASKSIFTTLCFDEFFGSSFFSGVAVSLMHDG